MSTYVIPPWLEIAQHELDRGVSEVPGAQDNPRIVEYHRYTSLRATDDETSWCSAFVNYCMAQAQSMDAPGWLGSRIQGTGKANARSWLAYGVGLGRPAHGCIAVLWRGTPDSWQGHVGFVVASGLGWIHLLGGNQSNAVTVAKYDASRVLGYRWPAVNAA